MSKNRIPTIKVESDDFTMEFAGEEYATHEGEYVLFVPYLSTNDTLRMLEAADSLGSEESSTLDALRTIKSEIVPILMKVIDSWTWTHPMTGDPLGKADGSKGLCRPTMEALNELSPGEQSYLIGAYFESRGGDEEEADPQ